MEMVEISGHVPVGGLLKRHDSSRDEAEMNSEAIDDLIVWDGNVPDLID